jgi:myo-inositol-1(or 4)-monophosphatase
MNERHKVARQAALAAAEVLREHYYGPVVDLAVKAFSTDFVSAADRMAEATIISIIDERFSDDAIISEEGSSRSGTSGYTWVIDPLDGTFNFLRRIPHFAVSIAVEDSQGVLSGVVADPMDRWLASAERGGALLIDDSPAPARQPVALDSSLLVCSFGRAVTVPSRQALIVERFIPRVGQLRQFGSAALDATLVALGRADIFYFEARLHPWDERAGLFLAERAGLVVERLAPAIPGGSSRWLACPPEVFTEFRPLID